MLGSWSDFLILAIAIGILYGIVLGTHKEELTKLNNRIEALEQRGKL